MYRSALIPFYLLTSVNTPKINIYITQYYIYLFSMKNEVNFKIDAPFKIVIIIKKKCLTLQIAPKLDVFYFNNKNTLPLNNQTKVYLYIIFY